MCCTATEATEYSMGLTRSVAATVNTSPIAYPVPPFVIDKVSTAPTTSIV